MPPPRGGVWLPSVLFLVTFLSTLTVGGISGISFSETPLDSIPEGFWGLAPVLINHGLPFSLSIMAILTCHEMGHYLTARYYGVDTTLPYFIPFPISLIGTLGAFIMIRAPFPHRRALLDVGLAGPFAGFIVTLPLLALGVAQSRAVDTATLGDGGITMGEPLAFVWAAQLFGPSVESGQTLLISPVGLAAWFGLLLTALNLMPIGQLDGGHASYAVSRSRAHRISRYAFYLLLALSVLAPTWLFWAMLSWLLGVRRPHPPTLYDSLPLPNSRVWVAVLGLLLFIICFTPEPIVASWSDVL